MSQERREKIVDCLGQSEKPVSASTFARDLGVTRQVIVGDVALLRASGVQVVATPRGYILEKEVSNQYIVACAHDSSCMLEELYTVIDCDCGFVDVTVEHPLYGEITCNLHLFSRTEAEEFVVKFEETGSRPLSEITNHFHLHRLQCPSPAHFEKAVEALREKGLLHPDF